MEPEPGFTSFRRSLVALPTSLGLLLGGLAAAQEQGPRGGTFPAQPNSIRLDVEPSGGTSNLNGIFEPGETVLVQPAYYNGNLLGGVLLIQVAASNLTGPPGATYTILDGASHYSIPQYGVALCDECYVMSLDDPAPRPALHWDVTFDDHGNDSFPWTWVLHIGSSFTDVPSADPFYKYVETLFHNEVTAGCGGATYCPSQSVTRSQAAVLLLKAEHTSTYIPPGCTGVFADVPCPSPFADWIEQLAAEGITAGCGGGFFCPDAPVTRAQVAVLLLKTKNGSSHVPPSCTGLFIDVYCPGVFTDWVEELAATGVSAGCGAGFYCPDRATSRGEQAVFVVKTFGLTFPFPYTPTP